MKDILVVGDSCKDVFIYCTTDRLCPDVPVQVLVEVNTKTNDGMAKNVYNNIKSYIKNCDIITNEDWESITKTRYVHCDINHTFIRVDTPNSNKRLDISKLDLDYKIIVVSDYNKGFLSQKDIQYICNNHPLVFVDTKKKLGDWAKAAKFIKINNIEYKNSYDILDDDLKEKLIHTHGDRGCYYKGINYPVEKVMIRDTAGAGDTFMAALVIEYFKSSNIEKAIQFANKSASKVVTKRGVTTI